MMDDKANPTQTFLEKKYPSHTQLYKNLHLIEEDMLAILENELKAQLYVEEIKLEQYNWDIIIGGNSLSHESSLQVYIEYKSSINEWGKQVDAFFRQINKRKRIGGKVVLLSFDSRFEDYRHACKRAGITLVVLPEVLLKRILHGQAAIDEELAEEKVREQIQYNIEKERREKARLRSKKQKER